MKILNFILKNICLIFSVISEFLQLVYDLLNVTNKRSLVSIRRAGVKTYFGHHVKF